MLHLKIKRNTYFLWLAVLMFGLCEPLRAVTVQDIESLMPGHWIEVPNSRLNEVAPTPFDSRVRNVMDAWSGGAYDTKRNRLIVWGGGHGDYWGNEVYVFDVNTLKWKRLNEPYWPAKDMGWGEGVSVYPDGSPASRHTYDGIEYLPTQDRFWINGGSRWRDGDGDKVTALFDFDALKWHRVSDSPHGGVGVSSGYDAVTGHIFLYHNGWLMQYDPASDRWTSLGQSASINGLVGEVDPGERKFVLIGKGHAYVYDLNGTFARAPLNSVGSKEIENGVPGLAYDPVSKRIVAWQGGADVYTLDLAVSSPRWTKIPPAPDSVTIPTPGSKWGTYGRWRYVPSKKVFIGVNSTSGNVYFYKLTQDNATDSVAPSRPRDLTTDQ